MVVVFPMSRSSSSSSILEDFLPHLQSEEEDWKQFAYLLDVYPLEKEKKNEDEEMGRRMEELYGDGWSEERSEEELPRQKERLEEVRKILSGMGREECGGVQVSRRLQCRAMEEKMRRDKEEKNEKKEKEKEKTRKRKLSRRHSPHISHAGRALDPSEISLGSPSQLAPRSPKKRRDSERTLASRKEEGWDSIADRVRRRERTSESDESSVKRERRVKVELPDTHVPSPSSQENEDRCFCGKTYNPKKQYLQCVMCSHHHHLRCLQLSEKKARKMSSTWVCHSCQQTKKEEGTETELFCLCQTPYDDSKFYVGCDKCEGWYHPKCVNITQEEAETVAEYICPLCMGVSKKEEEEEGVEGGSSQREDPSHSYSRHKRTTSMSTTFSASLHLPRNLGTLGRSDFSILRTLIEGISNEQLAAPFRFPVDTNEYPDYTQVNPHPMDLSEIRRKIDQLEYRQLEDLSKDFKLMLENARRYNADGSQIYHDSFLLEVLFEKKKDDSIRAMEQKRKKMRKQSECGTVDSCLDIDTDQLMHTFVDPSILEGLQF